MLCRFKIKYNIVGKNYLYYKMQLGKGKFMKIILSLFFHMFFFPPECLLTYNVETSNLFNQLLPYLLRLHRQFGYFYLP